MAGEILTDTYDRILAEVGDANRAGLISTNNASRIMNKPQDHDYQVFKGNAERITDENAWLKRANSELKTDKIIDKVLKRDLGYEGTITDTIRNDIRDSLVGRGLKVNRENLLSTFEQFGQVEGKPGYEDFLRDQGLTNSNIDAGKSTRELAQEARSRRAAAEQRWVERASQREAAAGQAALAREQAVTDAALDYRNTPKADPSNERLSRIMSGDATPAELNQASMDIQNRNLSEKLSSAPADITDLPVKKPLQSVEGNLGNAANVTRSSMAGTRMAGFNPEGTGYQEQLRNAYRNRRYQFFEANKAKLKDMNWAQRQMSFMEDLQGAAKNQSLFSGQFAGKNTDDLVAFANRQQMGIENTYTIESAIKKRMAENIGEDEAAALNARLAKLKVGRGRIASGDVVSHATEHIKYKPKVPGSKGFGGAGKVMGVVGALALLGGVTAMMFRGGQQTNAQLYNPGQSYANY